MRSKIRLLFFITLMSISAMAQSHMQECTIRGKVLCDDVGVPNVVVTNGYQCTQTDKDGEYILPYADKARFVYISVPSDYTVDCKESTIPVFYKELTQEHSTYNFDIKKNRKDDSKHVFIAQADVQLTGLECLEGYKNIVGDCKQLIKNYKDIDIFGVDCGDIVGDTPSLFEPYIKTVADLDIPIFRAIGNHDMNYYGRSHETSYTTFQNLFGPVHYSFNKGKVHYIVINNNFFIGRDYFYMGYVDEATFNWLQQDLSFVDKDTPIFFIMHIPARLQAEQKPFAYDYTTIADQTVNAASLFDLLKPYDTHIISGHMHYNNNITYSSKLMEHITGAVCGTWWRGDICLDGTPQGYGVYEIDGKEVKWYYKSSGFDKEYQFRLYPQGSSKEYPQDIVANIWNWDDSWKVVWLEDGKVMGEMQRYTGADPDAEALCADKEKVKYDWISVITNEHMFRATPKNPKAKISILVTDRFGNKYKENLK